MNCGSYGFEAPIQVWTEGTAKDIWKCLGPIWRGINSMKKVNIDGEEKLRGGSLLARALHDKGIENYCQDH